jgi:hypothetical protein
MTITLPFAVLVPAIIYGFYIGFLAYAAVMNHGWGKLPLWHKILIAPAGLVFGAVDVVLNHTIACVVFLALPVVDGKWKLTISRRCAALIAQSPTEWDWRNHLADGLVSDLLLPFTKDY